MQVICLRALFSGIGALSVMVPHTPQLRRQLCVIQLTDFGEVQPCVATSSPAKKFGIVSDSKNHHQPIGLQ